MSSCCRYDVLFVVHFIFDLLKLKPNMGRVLIISIPFRRAAVVDFEDARKFPFLKTISGPVVA